MIDSNQCLWDLVVQTVVKFIFRSGKFMKIFHLKTFFLSFAFSTNRHARTCGMNWQNRYLATRITHCKLSTSMHCKQRVVSSHHQNEKVTFEGVKICGKKFSISSKRMAYIFSQHFHNQLCDTMNQFWNWAVSCTQCFSTSWAFHQHTYR